MVRVNLTVNNPSDAVVKLNFQNAGNLVQPINATHMNVVKFSIPSSEIPLMVWTTNWTYTITLAYGATIFTSPVLFEYRGNDTNIFEIDHLISMINTTFTTCVTGLNLLLGGTLPTTIAPYVLWNTATSLFSLVAPTQYRDTAVTPIRVWLNNPMFGILQTIPITGPYVDPVQTYRVIFTPSFENTYRTTYIKLDQTSISLGNFATPRSILVSTSMPVQSEIFTSDDITSNQSYLNVIQNYTIDWSKGLLPLIANFDFSTVIDHYRPSKMTGGGIYNVKVDVSYLTNTGDILPFYLPSHSNAFILLDFFDDKDICLVQK